MMIERVENTKYLSVIIDSKLRLEDHCDYMLKKIEKKKRFLSRIGRDISGYAKCIVYKLIIATHFEYRATLLAGMSETQLTKLQVAQNRAMRVILQCDKYRKWKECCKRCSYININFFALLVLRNCITIFSDCLVRFISLISISY